MPRAVSLFSLFLAHASDVDEELNVAHDVVRDWNALHGLERGVVVVITTGLRDSFPSTGSDPQAIINRQVVDTADLVVGVFWTRFGSATPRALSGTEEEIERSISAQKRVMIYFSDRPIAPSTMDSEQYKKVRAFKDKYATRGLFSSYQSVSEFRSLFGRHFAALMNEVLRTVDGGQRSQPSELDTDDPVFGIEFPARHWIVIMAALDRLVPTMQTTIDDLRRKGIAVDDIPDAQVTAMIGPAVIRGVIVDEFVRRGLMATDAAVRLGAQALIERSKQILGRANREEK